MNESNSLENIYNGSVCFALKNKNKFGEVLKELGSGKGYLREDTRYLISHSTYDQQKENELKIENKDSLTKEPFVNWSDAEKLRAIIKCGEQGGLEDFGVEDYLEFIKNAFKEPTDYLKSIACYLISGKNFKEMTFDDWKKFGFDSWSKDSQKEIVYRVLKFGGPKDADFKQLISLIAKFFAEDAEDFYIDSGKSVLEELADAKDSIFNNISYDPEADLGQLSIADQYAIFNKFGDQENFKPQNEAIKILHEYKKSGKSLEELKLDDLDKREDLKYRDRLFLSAFCKNKESATLDNLELLEFDWSKPIKLFLDNLSKYNNIKLDPKLIASLKLRLPLKPKFYAFQCLPSEMQTEDNFRFIIYPEIIDSILGCINGDNYSFSETNNEKELSYVKLLGISYVKAIKNILGNGLTEKQKKLLDSSIKALSKVEEVNIFAVLWQKIKDLYKYVTWSMVAPVCVSPKAIQFNPFAKTKVRVIKKKLSSEMEKINRELVYPKLRENI